MNQNNIKMDRIENLHTMSVGELNELMKQCKQMISLKGGLGRVFKVGQKCHIDSPKLHGCMGEITKVNTKKCKVLIEGSTWNVPHSMIELI